MTTTDDPVLMSLAALGGILAEQFDWRYADAVSFVLTGFVPPVPTIRVGLDRPSDSRYPVTTRILMSINPTTDPDHVRSSYARSRRRLVGQGRRHRKITEKHLALAAFLGSRTNDETWDATMMRWNRDCLIGWRYEPGQHRNFARDSIAARRRILAPQLMLEAGA